MNRSLLKFINLFVTLFAVSLLSCEGPRGPAGTNGEDGIDGVNANACLAPCHNSGGIWEQYSNSSHFAEILLTEEQETFTNNTGRSCGMCHAKDALASRLDGAVSNSGGTVANVLLGQILYKNTGDNKIYEAGYDGNANFAQIQCLTCHEPKTDSTNQHVTSIYVPGNYPLRTSTTQGIYIEKSATTASATGTQMPNYGTGNTCMMCHKSRKDVTDFIKTTNVSLTSRHWGPHEGPGADLYSGEGGYEFTGETYSNSTHVAALNKACVTCHMPGITENGNYGNHDFSPKVASCAVSGCHTGATDISSIQSASVANLETLLKQLQDILNTFDPDSTGPATAGLLSQVDAPTEYVLDSLASSSDPVLSSNATTRFANIYHDAVRVQRTATFNSTTGKWTSSSISVQLSKDRAGALYNYFLVVRSKGYGYHNYKYAAQLIFDSIEAFGVTPTGARPL